MQSVNDISYDLYKALYNKLYGNVLYSEKPVDVVTVHGGVSNSNTWISIYNYVQVPNSTKTNVGYTCSVTVEVTHKGYDYEKLVAITDRVLAEIYDGSGLSVGANRIAYIVSEPEINEIIEDEETAIYMRKIITIKLVVL